MSVDLTGGGLAGGVTTNNSNWSSCVWVPCSCWQHAGAIIPHHGANNNLVFSGHIFVGSGVTTWCSQGTSLW